MPYVSKDDILAYIDSSIQFTQDSSRTVELIIFKDYINNQLNLSTADSITITLFDSIGRKTYQYSQPRVYGTTSPLELGNVVDGNEGHVTFTITAEQAATIITGDLYVEVALTFTNYYPSAKTYILPRLLIGSLSAGNGGTSGTSGTSGTGGNGNSTTGYGKQDQPISRYSVEAINGADPTNFGKMTFNNANPALVTELKFRNLDLDKVRNGILENFLTNRIDADGAVGAITIVNVNTPYHYAIYKILGWSRTDITIGGGIDNDSDGIAVEVEFEAKSQSPVLTFPNWTPGQTISYVLDAYGAANSGGTTSGLSGTSGTSGVSGINGQNGLNVGIILYQNSTATDPYTITELQTLLNTIETTFYVQSISGGEVFTLTGDINNIGFKPASKRNQTVDEAEETL